MKRKIVVLMLCMMAASFAMTACGKKNSSVDSTEAVESTESEDSPRYGDEMTYDASKYVKLGDYVGLEVTAEGDYEVTDEDVKTEVATEISQAGAYYVPSDKTEVESGDVVNIDYVGTKDGEAFDGGSYEGYNLTIGSGSFIDGFEDGLIGHSVGETVELDLTFPESYSNTDLAGQAVVFTVTINSIQQEEEMSYDTLTDEYVSEMLGSDDVASYLESVRKNLEDSVETQKTSDASNAILQALLEECEIKEVPEGLLEDRIAQRTEYYQGMAKQYGIDFSSYLSYFFGMTEDEFQAELEKSMPDLVKEEMILLAIADKEGITEDEDAYSEYINNIVSQNGFDSADSLYEQYAEEYVRRMYRQDSALSLVTEKANVTYVQKDASEDTETSESVENTEE